VPQSEYGYWTKMHISSDNTHEVFTLLCWY